MLTTRTIRQFDSGLPGVFAFHVDGEVTKDDMHAMARCMNDAFDARDEVDMLLVFRSDEGATAGARLDIEVQKAQFRSLNKVRNYVVAGAPERAETMLETFEKIMPVDVTTFATESEALAYLRHQQFPA